MQVEDEEIVEPEFAVTSAKHEHLIVDDARCVELAHGCLAANYVGNIESQFVDALFEIDEDHIRKDLESVPAAVNDNLAAVPDLTGVAHARLRKLILVDLGLEPRVLLGVENEDVVYYALLAVALSSAKNDEILTKLRR